jgi:hypothetical protein
MEIGVPMEAFEADTFTLFSKYAASSPILSTLQELRVQASGQQSVCACLPTL